MLNNGWKGSQQWMSPLARYDWTDGGEHDGFEVGSQTEMLVLPNAGVYLAVLTNTDGNAGDLAAQNLASVFVEAVQADPPTSSSTSSPTDAPTGSPTASFGCFSGHSTVQVQNRGEAFMKDVKVGDFVLVDDGKYEPIYSFGHRHDTQEHDYLLLLPSRLEISKDHMVFVQDRGPIPASLLRIGDRLSHGNPISCIQTIQSHGVYAPFTPSGAVVVNKVLASTYISLQDDSEYLMIGSFQTPFRYQWLAHTFQIAQRLWCHWLGHPSESYTKDGISTWVERPFLFMQWILKQNPLVTMLLLTPCLLFVSGLFILQSLIMNVHLLMAVGSAYLLLRTSKFTVTSVKS